jgi:hypothetical protein
VAAPVSAGVVGRGACGDGELTAGACDGSTGKQSASLGQAASYTWNHRSNGHDLRGTAQGPTSHPRLQQCAEFLSGVESLSFPIAKRFRHLLFLSRLLIGDLHWQKFRVRAASEPPFAIQFPPVEHPIRVHIMAPRHSRHRRPRLQGRFHDLAPPLFHTPPPLLCPRYPHTD